MTYFRRPYAVPKEPSEFGSESDTEQRATLHRVESTDVTDVLDRLEGFEGAINAMGRQMDDLCNRQTEVADQLRSSPDKSHSSAVEAIGNWDDIPAEIIL